MTRFRTLSAPFRTFEAVRRTSRKHRAGFRTSEPHPLVKQGGCGGAETVRIALRRQDFGPSTIWGLPHLSAPFRTLEGKGHDFRRRTFLGGVGVRRRNGAFA
jgi:hypothetical protein